MDESDEIEDLEPLLEQFQDQKDAFDELGKSYRNKACTDRNINKYKRAKKAFVNGEDSGNDYFEFNLSKEPYVSPHYYNGLQFESVHQKYFDQLNKAADEKRRKQQTLIGKQLLEKDGDDDFEDDYTSRNWLTLTDACCKEPCSCTNICCTACNIVEVLKMSRNKVLLSVAFALFVVSTFAVFVPLVVPFGFYFGTAMYQLGERVSMADKHEVMRQSASEADYDSAQQQFIAEEHDDSWIKTTTLYTTTTSSTTTSTVYITEATIAPIMDLSTSEGKVFFYILLTFALLTLACWIVLSVARKQFRESFGIEPNASILSDLWVMCWCTSCAVKQMQFKAQQFKQDLIIV